MKIPRWLVVETWRACGGLLVWCIMACGMLTFTHDKLWAMFTWMFVGFGCFRLAVFVDKRCEELSRKDHA